MAFSARRKPPRPADSAPVEPPSAERLRSLAFALLAQKEWSQRALCERLLDTGADRAAVEALVAELRDSGYQSDARMAGMVVRANLRRGRGPARIRQDFQQRQVDPQLAAADLAATDWLQMAQALRARKFGPELPTDPKEKARQLRFLQYRGFELSVCLKALQAQAEPD